MSAPAVLTRRAAVRSSLFGALSVSLPNLVCAEPSQHALSGEELFHRYPSIDDSIVSEVVGASHFNFKRVKELVEQRPELARATWDWGFGDWESAIGAASHTGRRNIVALLIEHGARPTLFTWAVLGHFDVVKAAIEATPGVQSVPGPHGISLLTHAQIGLRGKDLSHAQRAQGQRLVAYLEKLSDAGPQETWPDLTAEQQQAYVGDYLYGDGPKDGFSVKLNMRKLLALGKIGQFGGALYVKRSAKSGAVYGYNGTTSVEITFQKEGDRVVSLTVTEPGLTLIARRKAD